MVLGRLAICKDHQRAGLGVALMKDCLLRALKASESIGIKAILVHAIDDQAKNYYEKLGFYESPIEPLLMMITLRELERVFT